MPETDIPTRPRAAQLARRYSPGPLLGLARRIKAYRARGPRLGSYTPRSTLEVPAHRVPRSRVPAIDFHTHLGRWLSRTGGWTEDDVGRLLLLMDSCNIASLVNLDGRWGPELEANLDRYDRAYPGRFYTFCHLDWRLLEQPDGPDRLTRSLERSVAAGARGLKIWKDLGMSVRVRGRLILLDDPMLGPVWDAVADLGIPMLIHVADPLAFYQPVDHHNERLEELLRRPDFSRHKEGLEEYEKLIDSLEHLVSAHPRARVVAAHVGCVENLARMSTMLSRYPNLSVDIAWRASDLGRQPRASRRLCLQHPDRVVFGTDAIPLRSSIYEIFFRLLETDDEAFAYSDEDVPPCGRWPIYGLDLPDAVLEDIYWGNATRLLGLTATTSPAVPAYEAAQPQLRGISQAS